jgi:mono/diheme cytochrome c family protein
MLRTNNNFSLALQTLDGGFHFLPKSELTQVDVGSRSLMPAATLNSKEVDDLVSYLLRTGDESTKHSPAHSAKSDNDDD